MPPGILFMPGRLILLAGPNGAGKTTLYQTRVVPG
ncbi:hypothetical protein XINFAN_00057 [Pseudogemmobacter humi]|uniref:ABC transporter domain-containing protein n=1 Tax=Pseudogemmobacter humi TaxID=2483812 RepID=A0A3P5WHU3_9RHOB|nr:hypothetical protein XINFAN_00057 [Pseudogemmobacter humi]